MAPKCSVKLSNCVVMYDIVRYFIALSYSDTVVVILSDWRETGAGTTENMNMYIWSKLPLPSCKSFCRRKTTDDLKWLNYCYLQFMVSMLENCIMQFLKLKKAFWKSISVVSIFVVLALLVIWVWCHQVVTLPSNWSDERVTGSTNRKPVITRLCSHWSYQCTHCKVQWWNPGLYISPSD